MLPSIADTIKRLRHVLQRRGVSPEDSDDLIQEAFGRLEAYRRERHVEHAEGFLVRTAVNLAIDAGRRRKRSNLAAEPVETFIIVDESPQPDEVYASRRRLDRLNEGFAVLDPLTRQMIRAQRMEGLTVAGIAERHSLSISAVEKRLAKGMLFLVNWMEGW
jgi:RNA polymerase sigma factor (sigma-70 family)